MSLRTASKKRVDVSRASYMSVHDNGRIECRDSVERVTYVQGPVERGNVVSRHIIRDGILKSVGSVVVVDYPQTGRVRSKLGLLFRTIPVSSDCWDGKRFHQKSAGVDGRGCFTLSGRVADVREFIASLPDWANVREGVA